MSKWYKKHTKKKNMNIGKIKPRISNTLQCLLMSNYKYYIIQPIDYLNIILYKYNPFISLRLKLQYYIFHLLEICTELS